VARVLVSFAVVAVLSVLSGCGPGPGPATSGGEPLGAPSVEVMSKGFTVAGPRGFCVDPAAIRETDEGAFVLLGSCTVISGNPNDAVPNWPAVLTASVAPTAAPLDDPALDRMAAFFASPDGRAALARTETGGEATVLDLARADDMVLVHAEDGAKTGEMAGDYWRAVFTSGGQLVTITVSGFRATPIPAEAGARLARDFADAIRRANPAPGASAARGSGGLAAFFNRLL